MSASQLTWAACLSLQLQPLDDPLQVPSPSQNIVLSRDGSCQSSTLYSVSG